MAIKMIRYFSILNKMYYLIISIFGLLVENILQRTCSNKFQDFLPFLFLELKYRNPQKKRKT